MKRMTSCGSKAQSSQSNGPKKRKYNAIKQVRVVRRLERETKRRAIKICTGELMLRILDLKLVSCPLFYRYWEIPWNVLLKVWDSSTIFQ